MKRFEFFEARRSSAPWVTLITPPRAARAIAWIVAASVVAVTLAMVFVPWLQVVRGTGQVFAYDPADRRQMLDAPISGRVVRWYVHEGQVVNAGDPIVEIRDNDPNLEARLELQAENAETMVATALSQVEMMELRLQTLGLARDSALQSADQRVGVLTDRVRAAQTGLDDAAARLETAELNITRQRQLEDEGLASTRSLELAEMELRQAQASFERAEANLAAARQELNAARADRDQRAAELEASLRSAESDLRGAEANLAGAENRRADADTQLARQRTRVVSAPMRGRVQRIQAPEGNAQVSQGETLATFIPLDGERAVELLVRGLDAPLVREGSNVRLQFEGWPSVQFTGYPGLAVGTFDGVVDFVDPADNGRGQFRVVVVPAVGSRAWPDSELLRQGVRAKGWIIVDEVPLGMEIWRQLNGFPPQVDNMGVGPEVASPPSSSPTGGM